MESRVRLGCRRSGGCRSTTGFLLLDGSSRWLAKALAILECHLVRNCWKAQTSFFWRRPPCFAFPRATDGSTPSSGPILPAQLLERRTTVSLQRGIPLPPRLTALPRLQFPQPQVQTPRPTLGKDIALTPSGFPLPFGLHLLFLGKGLLLGRLLRGLGGRLRFVFPLPASSGGLGQRRGWGRGRGRGVVEEGLGNGWREGQESREAVESGGKRGQLRETDCWLSLLAARFLMIALNQKKGWGKCWDLCPEHWSSRQAFDLPSPSCFLEVIVFKE